MKNIIKRTLLIFLMILQLGMGFGIQNKVKNRFDLLKKKINKALKGREGYELFFDVNEFEFPEANSTIRQIHREQWEDYYKCLKDRYAETGPEKTTFPISLMALEGTSVILKCQICISPSEMHKIEAIEWFFNSSVHPKSINEQVYYTEHLLISPDAHLRMYNIQLDEAGEYWCQLGDTIAAPYYLYVDNGSEPIVIVRSDEAPKAIHSETPTIISEYNLKAYSSWTDWSECSTCDAVGEKIRYGYCTISLLEESEFHTVFKKSYSRKNLYRYLFKRKVANEDNQAKGNREKYDSDLGKLINYILPIFRNKMPCRSKYTPLEIQNIIGIKKRKSEIMHRYCKVPCPRNEIFEVRDKHGNVLESANNSAGIYSIAQGPPELIPMVARVTLYRQHNKKCELKCPGNLNTDAPIVWKVRNKILTPSIIKNQSSGRIEITSKQSIIFKKLRFTDKNIYSCWQNNELAGTIRLEVSHDVEIKFDHHVIMIGGIVIIIVFLKVFWRAFQGRKRYTMH
ncbi:uncharacterized protein LOC117177538 [Belonocnema kinseyi]|uniref:uncharacterized protein LOC117177538 n=1 Tax=Belonocnema kinseyi TaxID=2817044 RepID=UPI00143D6366|nr:uncharacterized protein LOC117177538 [Belonocnema kinseyi]